LIRSRIWRYLFGHVLFFLQIYSIAYEGATKR